MRPSKPTRAAIAALLFLAAANAVVADPGFGSRLSEPPLEGSKAPCIEAVLFDLGNTLMERGAEGLFELRAGARETVHRLQATGAQVGVITNVPADWTRRARGPTTPSPPPGSPRS